MRNTILKTVVAAAHAPSLDRIALGIESARAGYDEIARELALGESAGETQRTVTGLESISDPVIRDQAAGAVLKTYLCAASDGEVIIDSNAYGYEQAVASLEGIVGDVAKSIGNAFKRAWEFLVNLFQKIVAFVKRIFGVKEKTVEAAATAKVASHPPAEVKKAAEEVIKASPAPKAEEPAPIADRPKVAVPTPNGDKKVDASLIKNGYVLFKDLPNAPRFHVSDPNVFQDIGKLLESQMTVIGAPMEKMADGVNAIGPCLDLIAENKTSEAIDRMIQALGLWKWHEAGNAAITITYGAPEESLRANLGEEGIMRDFHAFTGWFNKYGVNIRTSSNYNDREHTKITAAAMQRQLEWWNSNGKAMLDDLSELLNLMTESMGPAMKAAEESAVSDNRPITDRSRFLEMLNGKGPTEEQRAIETVSTESIRLVTGVVRRTSMSGMRELGALLLELPRYMSDISRLLGEHINTSK